MSKHLIDKAIDISRSSPVVVLIDKADQLLWCAGSDNLSSTQSYMKIAIKKLFREGSEAYIIAATDTAMNEFAQQN